MQVSIDVHEVDELADDLENGAFAFEGQVHLVVAKGGLDVVGRAQELAPVRTGALRSSIGMDFDSDWDGAGFTVGPTVEYGDYVEQGTHGPYPIRNPWGWGQDVVVMHPGETAQPYLAPGYDMVEPGLLEALGQAGENVARH